MHREVNQVIKMFVFFDGGNIIPVAFSWNGKRYEDLKIVTQWAMRKGQRLNQHFYLKDETNTFEVILDTEHLHWKLKNIWTEQKNGK